MSYTPPKYTPPERYARPQPAEKLPEWTHEAETKVQVDGVLHDWVTVYKLDHQIRAEWMRANVVRHIREAATAVSPDVAHMFNYVADIVESA